MLHKGQTDTDRGVKMPQWRSYITSVVHRDLKPENIGIKRNADGEFYAVLADFGLAHCLLRKVFPTIFFHKFLWRKLKLETL